jgi:hypothetical protein
MIARGAIQEKGIGQKVIGQIDTTVEARAAFVRPYLGGSEMAGTTCATECSRPGWERLR